MSSPEPSTFRVRISLTAGELEVEGSEAFVAQYDETIGVLAEKLRTGAGHVARTPEASGRGESMAKALVDEFPEALHALPANASGTDQILVAGYFAARSSSDNSFQTIDANKMLLGQGIKLSNASQSMKNNLTAKRVFKVGKAFRISKTGEDHLKGLIG